MKNLLVLCAVLVCGLANAQVLTPESLKERPDIRKRVYKDSFLDYDDNEKIDSVRMFQQRNFVPYPYIREADVLWSKRIWRDIEVSEKINLDLYYPIISTSHATNNRYNLFDIISRGYKEGLVTGFNPVVGGLEVDEFEAPMTIAEIDSSGFTYEKYLEGEDTITGDKIYTKIRSKINAEDIRRYRLKEDWYFDKQRGMLIVKILGIMPIYSASTIDASGQPKDITEGYTTWFYFPELRPVITNYEVYNPKNETVRLTFDDIFMKRMFSSHIIKEDNVFDRKLADAGYKGFDQLVESERIKGEVFEFEHDLWDY